MEDNTNNLHEASDETNTSGWVLDFFAFKKMITPLVIQILFWSGVTVCILTGGKMLINAYAYRLGYYYVALGLALIFLGPLVCRLYCEIMIVIFRINETLTEIKNDQ